MGRFGVTEVLIMVGILIFIFGAKKIPELAKGMGQGIKEFKKGLNEGEEEGSAAAAEEEEKVNG